MMNERTHGRVKRLLRELARWERQIAVLKAEWDTDHAAFSAAPQGAPERAQLERDLLWDEENMIGAAVEMAIIARELEEMGYVR